MPARRAVLDPATLAFSILLVGLAALRIYGLQITPLDLTFDEAQYWAWSRTLELGYFSKPPLIAWTIAATTAPFGDAEWAVRLAAPLGHAVTAIALFALARGLYGAWAGFWAGLSWLVLPAVWLSSGIISTDALMLPLWSIGLLALWRLSTTRAWTWAVVLGVAVGFGALAKYATLYFPLCALLAAWWSKPIRIVLFNRRGLLALVLMLAILAPNLYWNIQHSFATVAHTASNASYTNDLVNPEELLRFVLDQGTVIGPLMFVALLVLLWRTVWRAAGVSDEDKFLIAFILPPLLIICAQAFLSRANANWAVAAYPAAVVWICGCLAGGKNGRRFLAGAAALNVILGGVVAAAAIEPSLADRHAPALSNSIKRARAWEETAQQIALRAVTQQDEAPFTAVLVDDRETFYELAYYWRHARRAGEPLPPVRMWVLHADARNSAELADPMRPEEGARVLVVHAIPRYLPLVAGDFTVFRRVEHLTIPRGAANSRELEISVAEGFAPAPRDAAFEERIPR